MRCVSCNKELSDSEALAVRHYPDGTVEHWDMCNGCKPHVQGYDVELELDRDDGVVLSDGLVGQATGGLYDD